MIHPTAHVDPEAEIGPDCVIEAHAAILGRTRLGARNRVGRGALIGGLPQDLAFDPATESGVEIGEGNMIREYCTIHRGSAAGSVTRLGDRNFLMVGAHLGHNAQVGNDVVIANNVLLAGYVTVGDRCFLGGGSVVHQHVRIGRGAMLQGGSAISKDVPPFCVAALLNVIGGLNVVGLRRAGYDAAERAEIKAAFKLLYGSGLNVSQALERARERAWGAAATEFFAFAAGAKKRGLCAMRRLTPPSSALHHPPGE